MLTGTELRKHYAVDFAVLEGVGELAGSEGVDEAVGSLDGNFEFLGVDVGEEEGADAEFVGSVAMIVEAREIDSRAFAARALAELYEYLGIGVDRSDIPCGGSA